ncbi:MAG: hypothetical protein Ta2B_30280 [Termitinemataceae bacterium]|nr:MAG: hypothetical protein Ta2B_30280 [Termitinemataceae bacterium]
MIHSNLENTTGARGSPHIFFMVYYPIKLKDPDGRTFEIDENNYRALQTPSLQQRSYYVDDKSNRLFSVPLWSNANNTWVLNNEKWEPK